MGNPGDFHPVAAAPAVALLLADSMPGQRGYKGIP